MKISNNILETIGNTPILVRLNNITSSIESQVLVKLDDRTSQLALKSNGSQARLQTQKKKVPLKNQGYDS